jgi:hypothetical protein
MKDYQLSEEKLKEYLSNGGDQCPVCGSSDIEGGERNFDSGGANHKTSCLSCNATWFACYNLVSAEGVQVETTNTEEFLKEE